MTPALRVQPPIECCQRRSPFVGDRVSLPDASNLWVGDLPAKKEVRKFFENP